MIRSGSCAASAAKLELAKYWAYAGSKTPARLSHARTADYTDLMANSQPLVAGEILDAYPLNAHRCLLDVGGGDGSFLIEAARRHAQLEVILFDLPAVAKQATERFGKSGIAARARRGRRFPDRSVTGGRGRRLAGARRARP
jgi:demethylspheroidene O-methyltransferase